MSNEPKSVDMEISEELFQQIKDYSAMQQVERQVFLSEKLIPGLAELKGEIEAMTEVQNTLLQNLFALQASQEPGLGDESGI